MMCVLFKITMKKGAFKTRTFTVLIFTHSLNQWPNSNQADSIILGCIVSYAFALRV